ncbi:hypothetical protein CONLIGDRAFT_712802 [Coniochaeta ligniaria NRRL 30616]|uniref:Uncharacterized protein n=1 Tax=Coniochaeta ligniaria NRRL 30616 TaxID=1408157 RepID=A0A1J7IXM6_9PEZI|nr:hypothetical protein CONLIGDRAFT_712802 [Coniochaeta ligniaria NRRL 30616]
MSDSKKTDHEKGNPQPTEDQKGTKDHDSITPDELSMAQEIFKKDLVEALAQQKSSGSNAEIEARIAKLKNELDTLDREIKATRQ